MAILAACDRNRSERLELNISASSPVLKPLNAAMSRNDGYKEERAATTRLGPS